MAEPCDPVSSTPYPTMPWRDIAIADLAKPEYRRAMAVTHHRLVTAAMEATTAAGRLEALGQAIGEIFVGLDESDGEKLAAEWRAMLADLASCGRQGVAGWVAAFGESTGNWWPPGSSLLSRGLVNAVVRSPAVEDLHTGDHMSYYDGQLGAMCANWAAVSLLDPVLEPDPEAWHADAGALLGSNDRWYLTAQELFPGGWAVLEALGHCSTSGETRSNLALPPGSAENAREWLEAHAGVSREIAAAATTVEKFESMPTTVRHAWSAPLLTELDRSAEVGGIATPSLTRLSRHPLHLTATLEWAVYSGVPIVTPNALIEATGVAYRQPLVAAPGVRTDTPVNDQAFHGESWTNPTGLSSRHAAFLGVTPAGQKPGRNTPCPCGGGAKYKHCHGRR